VWGDIFVSKMRVFWQKSVSLILSPKKQKQARNSLFLNELAKETDMSVFRPCIIEVHLLCTA